jgi:hypothetical protein
MNDPDATALTELDRLGARAAVALRERVDAAVELEPLPTRGDPDRSTAGTGGGEPLVVDLGRPSAPRTRPSSGRRALLAAAAVLILAGASAAIVLTRDDRPAVTSAQPTYLLPGWLPEGLGSEPESLVVHEEMGTDDGLVGDIAVYGSESADDPWAGPTVAVARIVPDVSSFGDESAGEPITVGGHQATLTDDDPAWNVEWSEDGARVLVRGVEVSRDEVLAAAAAASAEPAISAAGLPDGFAEIGRGPLDATATGGPTEPGLTIFYTATAGYREPIGDERLVVTQRPGTAASVDLARWGRVDLVSSPTTVRGQHAVVARFSGATRLQWREPTGTLVTLLGFGLDEDAVRRVAEELRHAGGAEIDRLISEHGTPSPTQSGFASLGEGQVQVVSGERGDIQWRLVASADQGLGGLTYEESSGGSASGFGGAGSADPGVAPPLEAAATRSSDGESWVVFGAVAGDASAVTVEGADGSAVSLDLYDVTGWDRKVFIGFLPADTRERNVVAHRPDGTEVARQRLGLSNWTDPPADGDRAEECVEVGDGTVECSAAGSAGVAGEATTVPGDG